MSTYDIQKQKDNFGCESNMNSNQNSSEHGHCCHNVHLPLLTGNLCFFVII